MARIDIQMNIRIPADLKAKIEAAAQEGGRSVTAELVARLERSFPPDIESEMLQQRMAELANLRRSLHDIRMRLEAERTRLQRADPGSAEYRSVGERISVFQIRMETLNNLAASVQEDVQRLATAGSEMSAHKKPRAKRG